MDTPQQQLTATATAASRSVVLFRRAAACGVSTGRDTARGAATRGAVTLLRVSGEDAFGYLQSQVSADLRGGAEQSVHYALWLNARGQVQADTFILRESEASFLLFSYAIDAESLQEIVAANIIADDVEIESIGDGVRHWALWAESSASGSGAQAVFANRADASDLAQILQQALGALAPQEGTYRTIGDADGRVHGWLFAGRNGAEGLNYDLLLAGGSHAEATVAETLHAGESSSEASDADEIIASAPRADETVADASDADETFTDAALGADATALPEPLQAFTEADWSAREAFRIRSGTPSVPVDIGPGDLPQEGGDLTRVAVSTSKGCYLGQEVIAHWDATRQVRSGLFRLRALCGVPALCAARADKDAGDVRCGDVGLSLPARLYAGNKSVGELRSFAAANGAANGATGYGLALLRLARLGDVRQLSLLADGPIHFEVEQEPLS